MRKSIKMVARTGFEPASAEHTGSLEKSIKRFYSRPAPWARLGYLASKKECLNMRYPNFKL